MQEVCNHNKEIFSRKVEYPLLLSQRHSTFGSFFLGLGVDPFLGTPLILAMDFWGKVPSNVGHFHLLL